jgi:hypothetical protein
MKIRQNDSRTLSLYQIHKLRPLQFIENSYNHLEKGRNFGKHSPLVTSLSLLPTTLTEVYENLLCQIAVRGLSEIYFREFILVFYKTY